MMDDESMDFSALDPTRDARFPALSSAIARDAMAARAGRDAMRRNADTLGDVGALMRPALLAAAIVLAVALPALAWQRSANRTLARGATATEVMGIPREVTDLLRTPQTTTLADLHAALAGVGAR